MKLDELLKVISYGAKITIMDNLEDVLFQGVYKESVYNKFTYTIKEKKVNCVYGIKNEVFINVI